MASSILFSNDFAQVESFNLTSHECLTQANSVADKIDGDTIDEQGEKPFEGVNISHPFCSAQISLYGGQILSFIPKGYKDLFWLSKKSVYGGGKAIRGGVPICWPWFGVNDKASPEQNAIKHGFARLDNWQVLSIEADENGVVIELALSGENQHSLWTNAYQLRQTLFFGKSFKQSLYISNLSSKDTQYSGAFHNYFNVSHPKNIRIDTLTGVDYYDQLTQTIGTQAESVNCVGEIDRVYNTDKTMLLRDTEWKHQLKLTSNHCQQWVLWNPGEKLANTMVDIHSHGEEEYVCLEAANTKWQDLPAGETVVISQEISLIG